MKTVIISISFLLAMLNSSVAQNAVNENVTCQQAFDLIQKSHGDTNFVILDSRPENMYNEEHIECAIYHDVFSENFENWLVGLNKNKEYLLYCNVGRRSGVALEKMRQIGFKNLYHLFEGIHEWKKQGFPTTKKSN